MLFDALKGAGWSRCVDVHSGKRDYDLLALPSDIFLHGHFLLSDPTLPYPRMLDCDIHHIFLYRDLRDALLSGMSYDRNCVITKNRPMNAILNTMDELSAMKYLLREQHDADKPGHHLLTFKAGMETARRCLGDKSICSISFEALKRDPVSELKRALANIGAPVDELALAKTAEANSFAKKSGREPGTENKSSLFRKGISGDWKNRFDEELKDMFKAFAGDFLIETGYEKDKNW